MGNGILCSGMSAFAWSFISAPYPLYRIYRLRDLIWLDVAGEVSVSVDG